MIVFRNWNQECNKKLRKIVLRKWNKTRTNSFLKMGNSSSNVPNVFQGSSLTGHRFGRNWLHSLIFPHSLHIFKILNANNEFCCLQRNIYLPEGRREHFFLPGLLRFGSEVCIKMSEPTVQYGISFLGLNAHPWHISEEKGISVTARRKFEFVHFVRNFNGVSNESLRMQFK